MLSQAKILQFLGIRTQGMSHSALLECVLDSVKPFQTAESILLYSFHSGWESYPLMHHLERLHSAVERASFPKLCTPGELCGI